MAIIFKTDKINYAGSDSGCEAATAFLTKESGEPTQSSCQNCPFKKCVYDRGKRANAEN